MLHTIFWASSYQKYLKIQQLVDDEKVRSKSSEDERGVGEQSHPPHPPDKNEHEMVMIMSAIVLFNAISWSLSNIIIIVGEQSHPPDPPGEDEHEDDGGGGEDLDEDGGDGDDHEYDGGSGEDLDEDGW